LSSSSVRIDAAIVLSTMAMLSVRRSRKAICTAVNGWNAASSMTALISSSKRTGRTAMFCGRASTSPEVTRR
jgi:hypothetical protein